MAKRSLSNASTTLAAFADAANFTDSAYPLLLQGGSSTQQNRIMEVYLGGQAAASSVEIMLLSRDSTVAATVTADATLNDAALDAATAALAAAPVTGNKATTKPQRSATLHLLTLTFNAFGGIVRWVAAPGEEISTVGNTASLGEVSLSAFTGSAAGVVSAHLVYEPM